MSKKNALIGLSLAALLAAAPAALAEGPERGGRGGGEHGAGGAVIDQKDATGAGQRSDVPNAKQGGEAQRGGMEEKGQSANESGTNERAGNQKSSQPGEGKTQQSGARDEGPGKHEANGKAKEEAAEGGDHRGGAAATGGTEKTGESGKSNDAERTNRDAGKSAAGDDKVRDDKSRKDREIRQKVTSDERDRARDAFGKAGDLKRAKNVNVRVDVGVGLPRDVELYDLPPDIVSIVPVYRGYRYVEVDDSICIVDPDTYVIVDVIHRGGGHHASAGDVRLELSEHEQRFIRDHIDRDHRADIRITIGRDVPNSVELYAFPEPVLNEVPKIREFRYVVGDDGVAIVDPKSKDVVYVIRRS